MKTALPRNTQPVPTTAMSTPASAGPTIRARLKVTEFRLTAFGRSVPPTISTTNDWRTGTSIALVMPSTAASR